MRCKLGIDYVEGGYVDYGFSNFTLLSELTQFCEKKKEVDLKEMEKWEKSVCDLFADCERDLNSRGIYRVDPTPVLMALERESDVMKLWDLLEPYVIMSLTSGTSGGWLKHLFPSVEIQDTKKNVFRLLSECREKGIEQPLSLFLSAVRSSFWQMKEGKSSSVVVHVFPKNEPVKEKKLREGRHRSIQMPDWTYMVVERLCCAWKNSEGEFLTHDMAYATCGRLGSDIGGWTFGYDVNEVLLSLGPRPGVFDVDVSGWDKSLPFSVVKLVYKETFHPLTSRLSLTCAEGYNGYGIFKVGSWMFRLPPGCTSWSSGCLNTLCGNSMLHSALLISGGSRDHLVMGDDANICDLDSLAISQLYTSVGLALKKCEIQNGWLFCKRTCDGKVVQPEWSDILAKCLAKSFDTKTDPKYKNLLPMAYYFQQEYFSDVSIFDSYFEGFGVDFSFTCT